MPSDPPQLFIIAGPNGAGKSTVSQSLLDAYDTKAFDWDKEFYQNWSLFGYDPLVEEGVRTTTNELFSSAREGALRNATNFAFETNFHSSFITGITESFQAAGFETNLYFLLISSVKICKQRVLYRTETGGHNVSDSVIEKRFNEGLELLNLTFSTFDRCFLLDASEDYKASLIATFQQGVVQDRYRDLPEAIASEMPNIRKVLSTHQ